MENTNTLRPANPWLRVLAHCIDSGIGWAIFFYLVLNVIHNQDIPALLNSLLTLIILGIFLSIAGSFIEAFFDNKFGGTPGILAAGISVVNEQNQYLSYKKAWFRRVVGHTVSSAIVWLGYIWIFIDKEHRGWHDLISASRVTVKNKNGYFIGLLIFISLLVLNIGLASRIVSTIKTNVPVYQQAFEDIQEEFKPEPLKSTSPDNVNNFFNLPTSSPTPQTETNTL